MRQTTNKEIEMTIDQALKLNTQYATDDEIWEATQALLKVTIYNPMIVSDRYQDQMERLDKEIDKRCMPQ